MENDLSTGEVNPYEVLGISSTASNAEIGKAFAMAMKRKEYPLDAIAKARKILMNHQERLQADYLRPILPAVEPFQHEDFSELEAPAPSLELLLEFDEIDNAVKDSQSISQSDRRLGGILFSL